MTSAVAVATNHEAERWRSRRSVGEGSAMGDFLNPGDATPGAAQVSAGSLLHWVHHCYRVRILCPTSEQRGQFNPELCGRDVCLQGPVSWPFLHDVECSFGSGGAFV